jgi:hypothetical protein
MAKTSNAAALPHGYLLSEESFKKLEQIHHQLLLMANVVYAATQAEEDEPLQILRSNLGQCFEGFGMQVSEVLAATRWAGKQLRENI